MRHWSILCATLTFLLFIGGGIAAHAAQSASPAAAPAHEDPVVRSQFTRGIKDREPVDDVVTLPNSVDQVYYFTDIKGMEGKTIIHRWMYDGRVVAEVRFKIGGPRWRVYSLKTLDPTSLGRWTVVVTDGSGWPLHAEMFDYVAAHPGKPAPPAAASAPKAAPVPAAAIPTKPTH
ncbi:MAG: hypothetical protein B7Z66_09915 [Chromatiales bacterium 21-64-14]|nr:MAG: hypothetical protein B7Z66_09915 [Chromatiales bacterium 21-64-14]HQU16227.1 DUF2914 domain-containing protein [Gammaproteobacteria bacterium]